MKPKHIIFLVAIFLFVFTSCSKKTTKNKVVESKSPITYTDVEIYINQYKISNTQGVKASFNKLLDASISRQIDGTGKKYTLEVKYLSTKNKIDSYLCQIIISSQEEKKFFEKKIDYQGKEIVILKNEEVKLGIRPKEKINNLNNSVSPNLDTAAAESK